MKKFRHLKAVIVDWAGTIVDHGSRAPVVALERVFAAAGAPITEAEARADMGLLKKDHIRAILNAARVREEWIRVHGRAPRESDVESVFEAFVPVQMRVLAEFSDPITGVPEAFAEWRAAGLRLGSTTGYTRAMLDVVIERAALRGLRVDASVTPDEVGAGRPKPYMCYRNAMLLDVYPLWACVKIGDTEPDIAEGRNAGMWTTGVTATGNGAVFSDADYMVDSAANAMSVLDEVEARLAAGERPGITRDRDRLRAAER